LIAPALGAAAPKQPEGVSGSEYYCSYNAFTVRLDISPPGSTDQIVCGSVDGEEKAYTVDEMATVPTIKLTGHDEAAFYTLLLLNPDDEMPEQPHTHLAVTNLKGSDLASGDLSGGY